MSGESGFDRPLDRSLFALRKLFPNEQSYGPHPDEVDRWVARCPICQFTRPGVYSLGITERVDERWDTSHVGFDCWNGCDEQLIRLALGVDRPVRRIKPKRLPPNVIPLRGKVAA